MEGRSEYVRSNVPVLMDDKLNIVTGWLGSVHDFGGKNAGVPEEFCEF